MLWSVIRCWHTWILTRCQIHYKRCICLDLTGSLIFQIWWNTLQCNFTLSLVFNVYKQTASLPTHFRKTVWNILCYIATASTAIFISFIHELNFCFLNVFHVLHSCSSAPYKYEIWLLSFRRLSYTMFNYGEIDAFALNKVKTKEASILFGRAFQLQVQHHMR